MRKWGWFVLLLILSVTGKTHALTVKIDHPTEDAIPEISYSNGSGMPLELTLQLFNDLPTDSLPVLLWQVGLRLDGEPTAHGSVLFESMAIGADFLFGDFSAPGPPIGTATTEIVVSDTDPFATGVAIPAQAARNILRLGLAVSADADGVFTLSMSGFDLADPDQSSLWIAADGIPVPVPFDNLPGSVDPERSVLAAIRVIRVPEPHGMLLMVVGISFAWLTAMRRRAA